MSKTQGGKKGEKDQTSCRFRLLCQSINSWQALHWHITLHKEKSRNHQHMKARIVSTEMLQEDEGGKKEMATQIAILPKRTK